MRRSRTLPEMRHEPRDFHLVVFGATGYTGRLVAEAIQRRAASDVRWALAGRDPQRLAAVADDLGGVPTIVADARDAGTLLAMARRTRALVTTVGPYARHGTPVVAACVDAGTHYADLTGEPTWIRSIVDTFDDEARERGTRLVPACGFDSVPSDLGVSALQRDALARLGRPHARIVHALGPASGGISGGTIASGLDLAEALAHDPEARSALFDPDLLAPGGTPSADPFGPWRPVRHAGLDGWTAPFVMTVANAKMVRRTRHLLGEPWGAEMGYVERAWLPTWARAAGLTAATAAVGGLLGVRAFRRLAARWLPAQGVGPSRAARERGFFVSRLVGYDEADRPTARLRLSFDLDPGYGATARMLAEMGLLLAEPTDRAARDAERGGVLTPAVAGGARYLERLEQVGLSVRRDRLDGSRRPV